MIRPGDSPGRRIRTGGCQGGSLVPWALYFGVQERSITDRGTRCQVSGWPPRRPPDLCSVNVDSGVGANRAVLGPILAEYPRRPLV